MKKEVLDVLTTAISDVGYWRWWTTEEDAISLEFGGVLLYDETKVDKEAKSSTIALMFYDNSFLLCLDNYEDEEDSKWYNDLHEDLIEPFTLDPEGLRFQDSAFAKQLLSGYKHVNELVNHSVADAIDSAKCLVACRIDDVAFIAGGDKMYVVGNAGDLEEEDILKASEKWWEYWRDYWKKMDTPEAYEKDYACEVTIPFRNE